MEISKELLIKDLKEFNSIDKLFLFFTSAQGDAEYCEEAKQCYKELKWNQSPFYDVINSFWITFSYAMHLKYPKTYPIAKAGNVMIYKNHYKKYDSFPEKYFKENSDDFKENSDARKPREQVIALCKEYTDMKELAELCHTVANFMPCPQGFNSAKGLLSDVRDYFPLMIDKIQRCVDKGSNLKYSNTSEEVDNETIKKWHSFFIENQEKYCLSMYYKIEDKKIVGNPLFEGQSLSYPCPLEKEEVEECLKNMLDKINERADLILKKYNEEHKSNS